MKTKAHSSSTS